MTARKKTKRSYEEGMQELEGLIARLGEGGLSLEESMKLYEEGVALAAQLSQELDSYRRRIEQIDPETAEITAFEGE